MLRSSQHLSLTTRAPAWAALLIPLVLAPSLLHAQDVFRPPSNDATHAAKQQARLNEMEEKLNQMLEKSKQGEPQSEASSQLSEPPLLTAPGKGLKPTPLNAASHRAVIDLPQEPPAERILGKLNGQEIYVFDGMVRSRPARDSSDPAMLSSRGAR